ncbi:MAG: hypothetical protein KJZ78_14375 [Bryobacteraceae bacterium]|nr:hypothetical protein [Bryobacteraceae bacterium]
MINTPPGKPTIRRDGDCIVVHIPMTFKRRGGRKEIIVPQGYENKTPTKQQAQNALVLAVVRGHIWRDLLESGKVKSIAEIARANKVDGSYISRMLDLTLFAPDIIDTILDGKEPSGLSIAKLLRSKIPSLWADQRTYLGFQK